MFPLSRFIQTTAIKPFKLLILKPPILAHGTRPNHPISLGPPCSSWTTSDRGLCLHIGPYHRLYVLLGEIYQPPPLTGKCLP